MPRTQDTPSGYDNGEKLVVAAGLIIGLLCALLVMGLWSRLDNRWLPVGSPANAMPIKILAVDRSLHAFVRTTDGDIYLCGGDPMTRSCTQVTAADLPVNSVYSKLAILGPDCTAKPL